MASDSALRWQFWIDRGGTFTDVVARRPDGGITVHKLLSQNPGRYSDASIQGIRDVLDLSAASPIPTEDIAAVKMGTTVGTNALLERKGERTALVITRGFRDLLRIGYQNRPDLFALHILLPELLYERVMEVTERYSADGRELLPLDLDQTRADLQSAFDSGIRSVAVVLMHGYRYHAHELQAAGIAREVGFTQVSVSHLVSPLMKIVGRGDTTVVDAYLSPLLRRYVQTVSAALEQSGERTRLMFMQSSGGLTDARFFRGRDSILSGPAGGIVGAVRTSAAAGFDKVITFDMGGTSTDVAHYDGEYERSFETEVAGVRMRSPMMRIHTVAAGGGSVLHFDGARYRVGPDSAGAAPGPACYRRGGRLTVTDCNVILGRIQREFFPKVFGSGGDEALDVEVVREKFAVLAAEIGEATGDTRSPEQVAEGFLRIAVENMANAIKEVSVQRGYNVREYTLCCFGGAGGQHACRVADALGIRTIFIHPYAGVLSALGMGLADLSLMRERAIEAVLDEHLMRRLQRALVELESAGRAEMRDQGVEDEDIRVLKKVHMKYEGTDTAIIVDSGPREEIVVDFQAAHRQRYGFVMDGKELVVEAVSVEVIGAAETTQEQRLQSGTGNPKSYAPVAMVKMYSNSAFHETPVFDRKELPPGAAISGPAIIVEATGTNVIEPGWQAEVNERNHLILTRVRPVVRKTAVGTDVDPVMLEIFNKLFMSIAEQMGYTLQNTSYSVNIKERLDFSCAIFDSGGRLVANAPHIPVHLGSMADCVQALIGSCAGNVRPGEVYMLNSPYNGGTHLPDITVVTPAFDEEQETVLFYVASRGHHADVGGITPGSMPPHSRTINEEGVLTDGLKVVENGRFREEALRKWLLSGDYPARDPHQNIADLRAQIAANERGVTELRKMIEHYSLPTVHAYMQHVRDNAEESVRRVLDTLNDGSFCYELDDGSVINVSVTIDHVERAARIDFTGTSPERDNNFNAPVAVCKAVVLYVFRTLVKDDIPMNSGCLEPIELVIPNRCMLNPRYPAAVVAGNVETSQYLADALYGALGVVAASQGTMNNFTFGTERLQYYETVCGGSGATGDFDGTDAVHTHMTNTRMTDPEVLEWRFPVLLESFSIRTGSGGKGKRRGGDGVIRRVRFLEPMTAAILSSHRVKPPFGLEGGEPGACGRNRVERHDGTLIELRGCDRVEMQPGDVFVIETPGGGGYGVVGKSGARSL